MNDVPSIESLIDGYILEHGLAHGSRLPAPPEMAALLRCEEDAVVKALEVAQNKLMVTRDSEGWIVASAALRRHPFSFSQSAGTHGRKLVTDVIEKNVRLPLPDGNPFCAAERAAQKAIGLAENQPLVVIVRSRLLEGQPGAFHRAYLDPSRFPPDFLEKHDFAKESLVDIYERYKYQLLSRDTVLAARGANQYEEGLLAQRYKLESRGRVVLDAEQRLYARDPKTESRFVLEFLKASYFEHWKYEIKNRPAASE